MVKGLKTGRIHHYLSKIEFSAHLLAEHNTNVIDIREQYALLPREETQEIAKELGFKHPRYPGSNCFVVMTTDIVLTLTNGYKAICIKTSESLSEKNKTARRTLEKLLIEKTYWERRSITWNVITEKDLPWVKIDNLKMLWTSMTSKEKDHLNTSISKYAQIFLGIWNKNIILIDIIKETSTIMNISTNDAFTMFARGAWMRNIPIDLNRRICFHCNVKLRENKNDKH